MIAMAGQSGNLHSGSNTEAFYPEKEANHQTGLEVDHAQEGLQTVLDTAGLEALPAEYQKAAIPQTSYIGPEKESWNDDNKEVVSPDELKEGEQQSIWKRRWKLWAVLAALLIVIVVVAVAVPLSVRHKSSSTSSPSKNTPGNPSGSTPSSKSNSSSSSRTTRVASTEGVFNGTGFATLTEDISTEPLLHLFYQNYTGALQHAVRAPGGTWVGGEGNITTDARGATPLAAVNYTSNGNLTAHLFYIDSTNLLQEKISTDNMTTWNDGPLGDLKLEASEASTAMTAFYSGSWLGQIAGKSAGIRLYYGAPDNCIHELSYSLGSSSLWNASFTFNNNTNANAGMTSAWLESNATAQLWTLDMNNELQLWYHIYNTTDENSKQAPANIAYGQWAEGISTAPVNVLTNSSLTYALGLLVYQQPNSDVEALPPLTAGPSGIGSWGAVVDSGTNSIDTAMTGGTLAAAALPISTDTDVGTNGTYLYVFNQQNGSDISQSPWYQGTWATETVVGKRHLPDGSIREIDITAQLQLSRDMSRWNIPTRQALREHSRVTGVFSPVYNALCRHLSRWQRMSSLP